MYYYVWCNAPYLGQLEQEQVTPSGWLQMLDWTFCIKREFIKKGPFDFRCLCRLHLALR